MVNPPTIPRQILDCKRDSRMYQVREARSCPCHQGLSGFRPGDNIIMNLIESKPLKISGNVSVKIWRPPKAVKPPHTITNSPHIRLPMIIGTSAGPGYESACRTCTHSFHRQSQYFFEHSVSDPWPEKCLWSLNYQNTRT